jgi:glutaredoxin-related protein
MSRDIFAVEKIHPRALEQIARVKDDLVREVQQAIADNDVVVVGMKQNPHPKRARKLLQSKGIAFKYLEYGSYLSMWQRRLALKLWTGWPTFPMIFVKGVLIGGASDLQKLADSGELTEMLAAKDES